MNIEMRQAAFEDVPELVVILQEAAELKLRYDDHTWGTAPFTPVEAEAMVAAGDTHIASIEGQNVGSVTLPWADERIWGPETGNDGRAAYIHRLAVKERFRGYHVGELIIAWASAQVLKADRDYLRLDCSYENLRLCAYYEKLGFKEVNRVDRHKHKSSGARNPQNPVYKAALYQKTV